MFLISFLMFIGTVWLLWKRRNYGVAFGLLAGQFIFRLLWLRCITLSIFAVPVLDDLRQFHESSHGDFTCRRVYHGTWVIDSIVVLAHAIVLVR